MTKSLDAFKLWLATYMNLSFAAAMSCTESAATALRAFGLHLCADGHPRNLLVSSTGRFPGIPASAGR